MNPAYDKEYNIKPIAMLESEMPTQSTPSNRLDIEILPRDRSVGTHQHAIRKNIPVRPAQRKKPALQ